MKGYKMSRFMIREGWSTVLLTALVVWLAVWSIQQADWADGLGMLNWIMFAGLVSGFIVSKWRQVPSAVLHLAGMTVGLLAVTFGTMGYLSDEIGGRREKLSWLWDRAGGWLSEVVSGGAADDLYIFVVFICAMTFLLAYATMWFVIRARWIWAALVFPALVLLINLGYSQRVPNSLVVIYLFLSIVLLARFYLLQRETNWRRGRVEFPTTLPWRGMWVGSYLAVFVLVFGWAMPVSAKSDTVNNLWQDVDGPWRSVEGQFNDWFAGLRGPGSRGVGGFASFSDSFDLGGPLQLSDSPVVLVDGPGGAPYLAAHRYNDYTGRGWRSDVNAIHPDNDGTDTFIAPQIELDPGELVPVAARFSAERAKTEFTMELQRTRGSLMFAPEIFVSSDTGTNLVVSWDDVEETVDIPQATVDDVPSELATLVTMLQEADFTPPPPPEPTPDPNATPVAEGEEPVATPTPEVNRLPLPESPGITAERLRLNERNIIVSYAIDPSTFRVSTMTYAGTFPIYSDVEAVHARDGLENGSTYTVETLVTDVTNEQLRQAAQAYPSSVTSRYLALPDTVTQRTRDLARDITSDAANPYDAAKVIESYLRTNITYSENIPFPPPEVDVVDHVLFTDQRGYCEYYSSAFIVMMRSLGIPARMTVGFFPTSEEDDGGYLYRELNAHAWPEVYFDGYGWIGFEPTAARAEVSRAPVETGGGGPARPDDARAPGEGRLSDAAFDDMMFMEDNQTLPVGSGGVAGSGEQISAAQIISRSVIGALMLLTIVVLFLWLRGMRGLSPANQFYAKLSRGAGWGGVSRDPSMTPYEYANSVGEAVPGSRAPAVFLSDLFVQETYGRRKLAQSELLRARQAWLRLRGVLFKHFFARLRPWGRRSTAGRDENDW
ncbi:hypothetical protein BH23CHL1_BH23CHL1_09050 [soil metagenome]